MSFDVSCLVFAVVYCLLSVVCCRSLLFVVWGCLSFDGSDVMFVVCCVCDAALSSVCCLLFFAVVAACC